ncbi:MAG TPA: hypothetical protein VGP10_03620 [Marisediminicola sp.]|jgi:ABC-type multidrug transport system permease subunit|nr:hypothetical protein [Marisediminicola sp.]
MTSRLATVLPVWGVAAIAALVIGLLVPPEQYLQWLSIAMGVSVLITFCIQVAIVRKEGLVDRVVASVSGAIVILAAATLVLSLVALPAG